MMQKRKSKYIACVRSIDRQAARSFWLQSKCVPPVNFAEIYFSFAKVLQQTSLNKRGRERQRNKISWHAVRLNDVEMPPLFHIFMLCASVLFNP